jgi:hypothetical protein
VQGVALGKHLELQWLPEEGELDHLLALVGLQKGQMWV